MIVDDEPLAIEVLKRYILTSPDLELSGTYQKPLEAFAALQQQIIDLLFLDIQMPGLTGLELVRSLREPPKIVLTTAFREFAVEGFDLEVLDYLVKPVSHERFLKTIAKFYRGAKFDEPLETYNEPFIFIKVEREMVKLKLSDILFIEGLNNYVRIRIDERDLIVYHTLSYLEDKLPVRIFKRVHKSFIINLNKIDKFTTGSVVIHGKFIPVGKMYQKVFEEHLKKRTL